MTSLGTCPECGGSNLYEHGDISAIGGYGPDLLPGASALLSPAKMRAVVCKQCGFIRFYAAQDTLAKIDGDRGWQRLP